ncbi:30S ribosomal protein S6 [Enterobacteriaceae bacterium ET-AT1-13]|nr:30S ribosomal protein S6 [Enterobacteriaceae bacterium ET-AT1-13]WGS66505.1 30S ribosomal protein S6 [Enterobacteriaceae bacterium Cmel17]WMC17529.1 MAG: 30S ribosomal protein S6 [Enterobacteriaceae bacterium Cmel21]WMC17736.1 MAG: 30S ribosomal protein S6 [Enterobacteriaceae bacterium PSmelAO3-2]WMC17940.1 MAG: 30S ribosomal protein S6 [Enterobacteriaceae bacterium PSmelAO3-1]WMC18142.1 MAG: 30S ribosomal protein S6 [Enterobacteriaceae bacterium PSmelAO1]
MRHYEIVIMFNLNKNNKILEIIKYYSEYIKKKNGKIYRIEDWGKRKLSYKIKKNNKAHYILLNIEISKEKIKELEKELKFNNFIIRKLIIRTKKAITDNSPIFRVKKKNNIILFNK